MPPTNALQQSEWDRLEHSREARLPAGNTTVRINPDGSLDIWNKGTLTIDAADLPALIAVANAALECYLPEGRVL